MDVSDSESEDYAPATKKNTKAAAKPKATTKAVSKPAAKPKASSSKKNVLVDKDDNASDADSDDDFDVSGPSGKPAATGKKKTASETYQKVRSTRPIFSFLVTSDVSPLL